MWMSAGVEWPRLDATGVQQRELEHLQVCLEVRGETVLLVSALVAAKVVACARHLENLHCLQGALTKARVMQHRQ